VNEDFYDFLHALVAEGVRFLVAGAQALSLHGAPRATGDLDVWVERSPTNADRLWRALEAFGAPVEALGIGKSDFTTPEQVVQIGVRPRRIDILTDLTGVEFEKAWDDRIVVAMDNLEVPFIDRSTLVRNKRATGRLRDRADLEALGEPEAPTET